MSTWQIDRWGWLAGGAGQLQHCPSPNADERPTGGPIDLLVVHGISLPAGHYGGPWIERLFLNQLRGDEFSGAQELRGLRVSAHILIRRDGAVVQYVSFLRRAWHAGVSQFGSRTRCNDFSIGIELEGQDHDPYTQPQLQQLLALAQALRLRYGTEHIRGHEHVAPGRKTDPGPAFDWSIWPAAGWPQHLLPPI